MNVVGHAQIKQFDAPCFVIGGGDWIEFGHDLLLSRSRLHDGFWQQREFFDHHCENSGRLADGVFDCRRQYHRHDRVLARQH